MYKVLETFKSNELMTNDFSYDLMKMMTKVDIPLYKVNHASFKDFMKKYTKKPYPTKVHSKELCEISL